MTSPKPVNFLALAAVALGLVAADANAQGAPAPVAWVPKPITNVPYTGVNKPRITLAEVQAKHRNQPRWSEVVGQDNELLLTYIQMAPGDKVTQMLSDQRLGMIVWDGQIRVSIDGQEPFIAGKGFMIQIPFRVPYTLEVVGDKPALRFETVSVTSLTTIYPESVTPPPPPRGYAWYKSSIPGRDNYERLNDKVYVDFFKEAAVPAPATGRAPPSGVFMKDGRNYYNIIRGRGIPRRPDTERGHFHSNIGEYWFIMEGQISFLIEGEPYFVAEPGDIVYAPAGRFHRADFAGDGMATRIAILGYYNNGHYYELGQGGGQ